MNIDGVTISQETNMNYCQGSLFDDSRESNNIKTRWSFTFYITSKDEISVQFRIPGWAKEAYVNGKEINVKDNYFSFAGCFDNEKIDIFFASELECRDLPGNSSATAILDGPIVLAAVDEDGKGFSLKGKSPAEMLL